MTGIFVDPIYRFDLLSCAASAREPGRFRKILQKAAQAYRH
jgi:hypothetical protein